MPPATSNPWFFAWSFRGNMTMTSPLVKHTWHWAKVRHVNGKSLHPKIGKTTSANQAVNFFHWHDSFLKTRRCTIGHKPLISKNNALSSGMVFENYYLRHMSFFVISFQLHMHLRSIFKKCDEKRVWGSIVRIRHRQAVRAVGLTWSRKANQITPRKIKLEHQKTGTRKINFLFKFPVFGCFFKCHVHVSGFVMNSAKSSEIGQKAA